MNAMYVIQWVFGFAGTVFWVWMLIDCIMNEPDRHIWIWVLLIANIPGAIVYFIVRRPLAIRMAMPKFLQKIMHGREINQAELDAFNVPNAYHYSKLGGIYLDLGDIKNAAKAYNKALQFDGNDIESLWGASQADMKNRDYESAKTKLEKLLKAAPDHQYGDALMEYCRALFETNDLKELKIRLSEYLKKWSNPEAKLMMATILAGEGKNTEAGAILDESLLEIKGSPKFYYNKKRKWIGKIKALKSRISLTEK